MCGVCDDWHFSRDAAGSVLTLALRCDGQRAAERERQKAQAAAAAERAAFEAQEARMAAELEQRTQQERKLLQEAAERARAAAEQRRKCAADPWNYPTPSEAMFALQLC